ncbi:MAG: hypothetical protein JJ913_03650 [Rhizobiaceae bacterium]|nr:hypothetical protein [Rhizobiaceae bacterium]
MTRDRIASTAASLMSLAAAALSLFVVPLLEDANLALQILALLLSWVGFFAVFLATTHILARIRYRKLLGRWYYVTHPHPDSPHQDGNYAIMNFRMNRDYDIEYGVHLYDSLEALRSPATASMRGTASSNALHYAREAGKVYVLFEVKYMAGDPSNIRREGRLSLEFNSGDTLEGDWTSEVYAMERSKPVRAVSSGRMSAFRTFEDLKKHEEYREANA